MQIQKNKKEETSYVPKAQPQGTTGREAAATGKNSIYNLLSNLKPEQSNGEAGDDSHSEDEDAMKLVDRKISMNKSNVIGLNLEKYNDLKPSKEVKRMISNLFMEYNESGDVEHCANEF